MVKFGPFRFDNSTAVKVPKYCYDMFLKKFEPMIGVNDFDPDVNLIPSVDKKITLNKMGSVLLELAKS